MADSVLQEVMWPDLALAAGTRALQRVNLADGDIDAAFDAMGTGLQADDIWQLIDTAPKTMLESALVISMIAVEADRENRRILLHAERIYNENERRWRRDIAPGQLPLDGIEPARYIPGEGVAHWKLLRTNIWIRARGCCEDCGRKGKGRALDMHHISYERYGHEEPTDVVLLCRDCHDRRHGSSGKHAPV